MPILQSVRLNESSILIRFQNNVVSNELPNNKELAKILQALSFQIPIQLVAPSAVTIAVATDAMICTMNLIVSFLVMVLLF